MRVPNSDSRAPFAATMTPMIDVVFLLIVFFLVSSHLARREQHRPLDLPSARSGTLEPLPRPQVNLHMQSDGTLWWNGRSLPIDQLTSQLKSYRETTGPFDLRLRCDRSLPYGHVEPALRAAAAAGVWNVAFAVNLPTDLP